MNPALLMLMAAVSVTTPSSTPNFTGVWEMDQVRLEITHRGPAFFVSMRVARAGTTEQIANTFAIGGETKGQLRGAPMISRTAWEGDTVVVRSLVKTGAKELKMVYSYTVSPDGKTLTLRERYQYASEREHEASRVLHRTGRQTF